MYVYADISAVELKAVGFESLCTLPNLPQLMAICVNLSVVYVKIFKKTFV